MFKVYGTYENFPAGKNLLKVSKLTNGKAKFNVLWCDFPEYKQVLLLEEIFNHPVKTCQIQ